MKFTSYKNQVVWSTLAEAFFHQLWNRKCGVY